MLGMKHGSCERSRPAAGELRGKRERQEWLLPLVNTGRHHESVVAELPLDHVSELHAKRRDPVARGAELQMPEVRARPISAARFGAAQHDHRLGAGQEILRPVSLGRRAEGIRIGYPERERAALARGLRDPGLQPVVPRALDIMSNRCAHLSFLSCRPTGQTRMHSKHCATLSL